MELVVDLLSRVKLAAREGEEWIAVEDVEDVEDVEEEEQGSGGHMMGVGTADDWD